MQQPPLALPFPAPKNEGYAHAVRILTMVQVLHQAGYQRLRIAPGMSASGIYWRCVIRPASEVVMNGWDGRLSPTGLHEHSPLKVTYSSSEGLACFGWDDAAEDSPEELAARFVARFPDLSAAGAGLDFAYAGWLAWMLGRARSGDLPVFFADYHDGVDPADLPPPP